MPIFFLLLVANITRAQIPPGFGRQEQKIADPQAERDAANQRMIDDLTKESRKRDQLRATPEGRAALSRLVDLELAHGKREKVLFQPLAVAEHKHKELLQAKLAADSDYQSLRATAEASRAQLSNDTAFAALMAKHREKLTLTTGRKVNDEEVLAAIRQTDDREKMRELLQKRQKIHEGLWKQQCRMGDRHREVEKTDPELRQSKTHLKDLRKEFQQHVLASDPELQHLAAEITAQQQLIEELLGKKK
jgi:hypothetical protein